LSNTNPTKNQWWIHVLRKGKQFVLVLLQILWQDMNEKRIRLWLRPTGHIHGHFWRIYFVSYQWSLSIIPLILRIRRGPVCMVLNWYILKNRRVFFLLFSRFYFLDNGLTSFFHVVFFKTILFLVSSRLYFLRQCSFFFLPGCIF
jgi:hypothetical protein